MKSFESESVKIFEIVKDLSFPRMVGSKGEKDAQIYIFSKLKKMGFNPIVKDFNYYYNIIFIEKGVSICSLIFFSIQLLLIMLNSFITSLAISILYLILAVFAILILNNIHKFKFGKQFSSKNIIYEKNSVKHREFKVKMGLIIVNTNYDSIGRKFHGFKHSNLQKTLLIITGFSYIITLITSFIGILKLYPIVLLIFKIHSILGLLVSIITSIIYFLNNFEDSSKGAVDNASGCAVLLNLIQRMQEGKINLNWMNLKFLFSGAKQIGTWGTKSFLIENLENFRQYKDVYIIDIDKIGTNIAIIENWGIIGQNKIENPLQKSIEHLAYQERIQVQKIHTKLSINKNFLPFVREGFEICSFTSPDEIFLYSSEDNIDKVNQNKLRDVSELIYNAIQSLDHKIGDKIDSGE